MKILVVSDSHRHNNYLRYAIGQELPFDQLIHCGDLEGEIDTILPPMGRTYAVSCVRGNCDWASSAPKEEMLRIGYYNVFVTHGDLYGVKYEYESILDAARQKMADIVLFGHSHVPENFTTEDNIVVVNPGSLAIPHQYPARKSYAVINIDDDGLISTEMKYLPDYVPENY